MASFQHPATPSSVAPTGRRYRTDPPRRRRRRLWLRSGPCVSGVRNNLSKFHPTNSIPSITIRPRSAMSKPRDHCPCHSNSAASTPRTPVGGPPRHMPVAGELPPLPRRYSASCPISQSLAPPTIRHRLSARDPQRRDRPGRSTRLTITPPLSSGPAAGQRAIDRARNAGAGRVAWSLRRRGAAAAGPRKRTELAAGTGAARVNR